MELEPSGGGANARSTHRAKGPGRARAAPASPEGAWAAHGGRIRDEPSIPTLAGRRGHHRVGPGAGMVSGTTLSMRPLAPQAPSAPAILPAADP